MRAKTAERALEKTDIGLQRDDLISLYRTMVLSRRIDDKEIQLKRQNKIYFQISGAGHEAVLAAAGRLLRPGPVLFLITDNDFAISVPVEVQTAGGSISRLARSFPGLHVDEVDGCDPIESYAVLKRCIDRLRCRDGGPVLVHAHTIRPYSHSLSDDERLYRTEAERQEEARRDPVPNFAQFLIERGVAPAAFLEALREEV